MARLCSKDDGRMEIVPRVPLDHHPATYEDLIAVPEHLVAEILDGELYTSPRPAPRHALAHSWLGALLMPPFGGGRGGPGGWMILDEPDLHPGLDVLVPDLAGWRRERMPRLPETAYFPLAPDWLCEIVSPSTAAIDRTKKPDHLRTRGSETRLADRPPRADARSPRSPRGPVGHRCNLRRQRGRARGAVRRDRAPARRPLEWPRLQRLNLSRISARSIPMRPPCSARGMYLPARGSTPIRVAVTP